MATSIFRPMKRLPKNAWLKPAVIVGSVVPMVVLVVRALTDNLGADPIATAMNQLGLLALILLLASLACSPLKVVLGWKWPLQLRKTLGLLGFGAAAAHFLWYLVLDQGFSLSAVVNDIFGRPFILAGFCALALLVPLARTSTKRALKDMGFTAWKRLHRLVYPAVALGVLHYFLRVKKDVSEPLVYAGIFGVFMAVRLGNHLMSRGLRRRNRAG